MRFCMLTSVHFLLSMWDSQVPKKERETLQSCRRGSFESCNWRENLLKFTYTPGNTLRQASLWSTARLLSSLILWAKRTRTLLSGKGLHQLTGFFFYLTLQVFRFIQQLLQRSMSKMFLLFPGFAIGKENTWGDQIINYYQGWASCTPMGDTKAISSGPPPPVLHDLNEGNEKHFALLH